MSTCEFCRIIQEKEEAEFVYENNETLAFAPLAPAVRGHTLVVPKLHVPDFLSASTELLAEVFATTQWVARGLQRALSPEGFNVITSAGEAATQTVFHFHVHVVPRWVDDRMGDLWPPKSSFLEETKDDVAKLVRVALAELQASAD